MRTVNTMNCPLCLTGKTRIIDTQHQGMKVYRRRKCESCNREIYTLEEIVNDNLGRYKMNWIRNMRKLGRCE